MSDPTRAPRFDTLFIDPRHYRADLRLVRTAIRRGWVRPEDRAALVQRLVEATDERKASPDPAQAQSIRKTLAEVWTVVAMVGDNIRMEMRARTGGKPGRPREREWVTEFAPGGVLNASTLRGEMLAAGRDISGGLVLAVTVRAGERDIPATVTVAAIQRPPIGVLLALICPRCGRYRMRLYGTRAGLVCRVCGRVGYRG